MWAYIFLTLWLISIAFIVFVLYTAFQYDLKWKRICNAKDLSLKELHEQSLLYKDQLKLHVARIQSLTEQLTVLSTTVKYLESTKALWHLTPKSKDKEISVNNTTTVPKVTNVTNVTKVAKVTNVTSVTNVTPSLSSQTSECVICLETVPMTCFIPCGHISTCVSCAKCMVPASCPICRCMNGKFYNVYNATKSDEKVEEATKNKDLHPEEVVKRKGLIRRFLDKF